MRALVVRNGGVMLEEVQEPDSAAGDALVDVALTGVCDTDLQLARGYMGFSGVPGHEFVGVVKQSADPSWIGKRVVADINAGCGVCEVCAASPFGSHHCPTRTVLGILGRSGAFAERLAIPERCLVAVPDVVTNEQAVFAEPLAAALHVLDDLEHAGGAAADPDECVVVLGDGKLGQLIARAIVGAGRLAIVVGRHEHKLALANDGGAATCDESSALANLTPAAAVVDATGSASGLSLALALTRPKGLVILKTTVAASEAKAIDLSPIVINELKVVGSRCGDLSRAMEMLRTGAVDPRALIAQRFPLSRGAAAFDAAAQKGKMKVLVDIA